jgi:membrane-associated phospholipid phosphatase
MHLMSWQAGTLIFLAYLAVATLLRPRVPREQRMRAAVCVLAGAIVLALSMAVGGQHVLNAWILPPSLLWIAYWGTGQLFVAPVPSLERGLLAIDRGLRVDDIAARLPPPIVEILELAYTAVYPLVPIALWLALEQGISADRFWTVVLVTDYICFGMLPWFQTRPPRSLGVQTPWRSRWRPINMRVLDAGSVQVNTFPSGHAAEAMAVFLILGTASWPISAALLVCALAISAGAVFGRYHYAADAIAGWLVALLVFSFV